MLIQISSKEHFISFLIIDQLLSFFSMLTLNFMQNLEFLFQIFLQFVISLLLFFYFFFQSSYLIIAFPVLVVYTAVTLHQASKLLSYLRIHKRASFYFLLKASQGQGRLTQILFLIQSSSAAQQKILFQPIKLGVNILIRQMIPHNPLVTFFPHFINCTAIIIVCYISIFNRININLLQHFFLNTHLSINFIIISYQKGPKTIISRIILQKLLTFSFQTLQFQLSSILGFICYKYPMLSLIDSLRFILILLLSILYRQMIPKALYKLKNQSQQAQLPQQRWSTQYHQNDKIGSSEQYEVKHHEFNQPQKQIAKNKLTKGYNKYSQIKDAHLQSKHTQKPIKTQYNQYTFQPNSSANRSQKHHRSFKKFIEDQQNFEQNRVNKIKQFQSEMQKTQGSQFTSHPVIDKTSRRICTLTNYDKQEVVERLYKKKTIEQYKDDEDLFSPKILPRSKSMKRSQNVGDLLHSDAKRRQQKREAQQQEKEFHPSASPFILGNTYKLVCNKLYNQFCELIPQDQLQIPIVMAWTAMSQIFGIELNPNRKGRQENLCEQMTKYLCKNEEETVQRSRLWEFIQIIVKKSSAQSQNFKQQINKIIQTFGSLYTCRIAKPKQIKQPEQYPFFPETNRNSEFKAQKYREKVITEGREFMQRSNSKIRMNNQISIEDVFQIEYFMKRAENEKKKLSKQKQEMKQCTFKPDLSLSNRKALHIPPRNITKSTHNQSKIHESKKTLVKSLSSHSLSHSIFNNSLSMNNTLKDINFKNNEPKKKLTLKTKKENQPPINQKEEKSIEKCVIRMALARKHRQLSNQIKSRGYPKNIKNWTQYTTKQKKQITKEHRNFKGFTYKKINLL